VLVELRCDLRELRDDVAGVGHGEPDAFEAFGESRVADRARSHVDATPCGTEVERRAEDVHGLGRVHDTMLSWPGPPS
jgi:hypothetical protein